MKFLVVLALLLESMHGSEAGLVDSLLPVIDNLLPAIENLLPTIDAILKETPNSIFFDTFALNSYKDLGETLFGEDSTIFSQLLNQVVTLEPEVTMHTTERVVYNGYKNEVHNTTTKDGYILRLDKIFNASAPFNSTAPPLLMVPGTICEADGWMANNKENNLPFLMADLGRPVWIISLRGTLNSPGHVNMTVDDPAYWRFSFEEMAKYDLPAAMDYILKISGHKKLYMTGHSLGGGIPILALAENPEYNQKVKGIFSLAPIGNMQDISGPGRLVFMHEPLLEMFTTLFSFYKFQIPLSKREIGTLVTILKPLLGLPLFKWVGFYSELYNIDRFANFIAAAITTTSMQMYWHYGQYIIYDSRKGQRKFDFGSAVNQIKYQSVEPPLFNLKNVIVPVYLFYGTVDNVCTKANVEYLKDGLPNVAAFIGLTGYDHLTLLIGDSVAESIFKPMLKIMIQNN